MILINSQKLDFTTFPNGETKVDGKQIDSFLCNVIDSYWNTVTLKYENDSDLVKLMFVKKHLDDFPFSCSTAKIELVITYMPYSRMDRTKTNEDVFTLKYVSEFINSLKFDQVTVVEPHSDVTMALLDKAEARYPTDWLLNAAISEVNFDFADDYLFFPDAGAQKRYGQKIGFNQLVGFKDRDWKTGKINSLTVVGDTSLLAGKKVIIVDDLCSYGGTFYGKDNEGKEFGAAAELKKLGAAEIYLVVAHAENAIFEGKILTGASPIDKVFTTNSIIELGDMEQLKVFNIL
jgi:ribose-phosphate pyrophosphokinase